MSRIDQALTSWEAGHVTTIDAASPSDAQGKRAALNEYTEERVNPTQYPPLSAEGRTPERPSMETTAAPSERPSMVGWKAGRTPEIEARLVTNRSNAVSIEQYRRLAAILLELQVDKQLKTAMITSAVPQEGKTLTVVNLGLTLSESYGRRVVMIDADLRSPSLHLTLGIPNGRGLCDALTEPRRELPLTAVSERLSVLTTGGPEGMPLAALSSSRMQDVIDRCGAQFDWVLIDTSPIGILPDASVLARLVGGVIFVIRAGKTPSPIVERAIGEIGPSGIIGLVLNGVEERRIGAASYYEEYRAAHVLR